MRVNFDSSTGGKLRLIEFHEKTVRPEKLNYREKSNKTRIEFFFSTLTKNYRARLPSAACRETFAHGDGKKEKKQIKKKKKKKGQKIHQI